jgi:hypothetical protein
MKSTIEGTQTKFFKDVKLDIVAGMEFNTKNYKMRVVGYEVFRQYFDSKEMDCQVGRQKIKRIIK